MISKLIHDYMTMISALFILSLKLAHLSNALLL